MTQADHKRDNARVGSSFHPSIVDVMCGKKNGGVMHRGDHTNHYWKDISNAIKAKMKGCAWQVRLASIESKVAINLGEIDAKIKLGDSGVKLKEIKKQLQ